ncbi:MAG: stage III sporulation protein AB [Clostridiales bacterium]|uniref:stage III sporulation protein SpoIIIAB n=1 Tax=Clostridium sp. N3C TaxID=1776758 RepID=UPI00092E00C4|nr:stage III sporulation protein SpoIIIAB [Clostridium sp. N3C]NLZ47360.1 stage III sporulation protein AB [Clostridiales bacterium]SCN21373.1 stage III sporulation protein SpoAB [Clostridium sp. N3C]
MIKIFGAVLMIGASTFIGFMFAEFARRRLLQLKELEGALIQLENEIFFTRTALPEACLSVSFKSKYPINTLFKKVSNLLTDNSSDSVYDAFYKTLNGEIEGLYVTKEDKDILLDLAKALGESDLEGHRKVFNLAEHNLKTRIQSIEANVDKNVKMYRYLGFSLGAAVAILLV